ncbi:MAG: hypothetical protein ACE5FC_10740, partial [Myxococcota bacterium]
MLQNGKARLAMQALLVFTAFVLACGPASDSSVAPEQANDESNEIQLIVDGTLKKTWSVSELMRGRFDWESPNRKVSPAVPVSYVLFSEKGGLEEGSVSGITIAGHKGRVDLSGDTLPLLDNLLLRLDLKRGGAWQLVGRDLDADRRLETLAGDRHLERIQRIEVLLGPDT